MFKKMTAFFAALCITIAGLGMTASADFIHRVSPGETMSGIAKRYGMTADTLLGNNQYIADPAKIYAGQVLVVPGTNQQAYTVKPGDTLFKISKDFKLPMAMLADINKIADPNFLYAGQVLMIPKTYTVKAGDTLAAIAKKLGVLTGDLAVENNLADPDTLYAGQTLIVPFLASNREELADVEKEQAPFASRFPGVFYYKGLPGSRKVALTFDDGPDTIVTVQVLDLLKKYRVPATFFLVGTNLPGKSDIIKRMVAEGHTVANHTYNHPDLRTLSGAKLAEEMTKVENGIKNIIGKKTALMRPPYGYISDDVIKQLGGLGYKVIRWSADTIDWRDFNKDQVLVNAMPNVRDGAIILMHDFFPKSATREVLPEIIQSLRLQGYTFVTIDKLLGVPAYK